MSIQSLFRSGVVREERKNWLGPVLLLPKMSHRAFAVSAAFSATALLMLLFCGTYPRKVRASGWIVPEGGLVQVFAPNTGVITDVGVTEGKRVNKGDRLVTLSTERESSTMGVTGEQVARQLRTRKQSLVEDRQNAERLSEQQKRSLSDRLETLKSSEAKLASEIGLQRVRVASASRTVKRQKALLKEGIASSEQVQQAEDDQIGQMARLRELENNKLMVQRDRQTVKGELEDLPIKTQRDVATIDRNLTSVEEEIAQLASQREIVMSAQSSGIVTALQAKRGGQPDTSTPLLAIVPEGAKLEANLFCSSRTMGFLKVGQRVLLRYESFPYQKFGHYEGTIASISQSAVSPTELAPQVASLARTAGENEAVYRVTVTLASQSVSANGKSIPLQPGMQLIADVVLENRRLVEWMMEPLFTVSGTWRR